MISDQLRTKQGPLARVWLASHWERKISKSQFLQTDLKKTIDAITTNQEEEPIALRVSGQLLLGVVRIYSRKTRYLLEDCNEALIKIKLAFKKGDVNMPNIQHSVANANTITLQDQLTEFDILLPDLPFNPTNVDNERDPVLDSIGDMSTSQDITLNDMQGGFSFGNYELGRGQDGIEVGRRDNEAGFLDNEFDMDAIADPLKDMNINEADNGLAMDNIEFDFDMADNIDYNDDDIYNHNFDLPTIANEEAPLVDVGIVQDDSAAFDMENMVTEPTPRRRRKLIVDENTEIPQADLYRYINDTSSIVSKPDHTNHTTKNATTPSLTKPTGDKLCSELDSMFSRMLNKRRASVDASEFQRQADAFGAPTPAAITDDAAFNYEDNDVDYGEDYDGGFDQAAHNNFKANAHNNYEDLMTQNTQSFNNNTHQTLETINGYLVSQNNVKFGELAPRSSIKKAEASKLFYDVLLLATKNKIKVKQDRSFGEIQISAPTLVH